MFHLSDSNVLCDPEPDFYIKIRYLCKKVFLDLDSSLYQIEKDHRGHFSVDFYRYKMTFANTSAFIKWINIMYKYEIDPDEIAKLE